MMAQTTTAKPVLKDNAIHLATTERPLITIEFAPDIHQEETEYTYEHPQFVFGERVTIGGTSFHYPPVVFTVCALELIESKTPSGQLLNQPRWKYKVTNQEVSYWKDETALTRYKDKTCLTCDRFNNYHEAIDYVDSTAFGSRNAPAFGKGWCNLFDCSAKTDHTKTNDCIVNRASELNDEPHAGI